MLNKIISICAAAAVSLGSLSAFAAVDEKLYSADAAEMTGAYKSLSDEDKAEFINDNLSKELLATIAHYDADDKDRYIPSQLTEEQTELVRQTALAVADGADAPTSSDKASRLLITLAEMTAQGGRESEVPAALAENLEAGNTAEQMLAVPLACVRYNGFPRTLNMMAAINNAVSAASATAAPQETAEQEAKGTVITMKIDDPKLTINGAEKSIDESGTAPVIRDDRTLLPIRAFVEGIGGRVDWDASERKVTLVYEDRTIELVIGSEKATLNGNENTLDTRPVIINDRTFLPIRLYYGKRRKDCMALERKR